MMALQLVLSDCADLLSEKTVHLTYLDGQNNIVQKCSSVTSKIAPKVLMPQKISASCMHSALITHIVNRVAVMQTEAKQVLINLISCLAMC